MRATLFLVMSPSPSCLGLFACKALFDPDHLANIFSRSSFPYVLDSSWPPPFHLMPPLTS